MKTPTRTRLLFLALLLGLVIPTTGCVKRTLQIRSEPSGAIVRLDGEVVGTTPVDVEFDHYGIREFMLEKEGYRIYREEREISTWIFRYFPFDFLFDVVFPFEILDDHEVRIELEAQDTLPPVEGVLERADKARKAFEEEQEEYLKESGGGS